MNGQSAQTLSAADASESQLRTALSVLQQDLKRKDTRLNKATSRAFKLEGLLLQTESEAEQLRAAAAENVAIVETARNAERAIENALASSTARFESERLALLEKETQLRHNLEEKATLITSLSTKLDDAKAEVVQQQKDLSYITEEQQAAQRALEDKLAEKEDQVFSLQRSLIQRQELYAAELVGITRQHDALQRHLQGKELHNASLQTKLHDVTIDLHNCELRFKEARFDADMRQMDLQHSLSAKENAIADLNHMLTEKNTEVEALTSETFATTSELEKKTAALADLRDQLGDAEKSLAELRLKVSSGNDYSKQQSAKAEKALAETKKYLVDLESKMTKEVASLSQQLESSMSALEDKHAELESISSRLDASQRALTILQGQHSESTARFEQEISILKDCLTAKESELEVARETFDNHHRMYQDEMKSVSFQLATLAKEYQEKAAELESACQQLRASQQEIENLRLNIAESSKNHEMSMKQLQKLLSDKDIDVTRLSSALRASTTNVEVLKSEQISLRQQIAELENAAEVAKTRMKAELDSAKNLSLQAAAESQVLDEELQALEVNLRSRDSEITILKKSIKEQSERLFSREEKLAKLQEENKWLSSISDEHRDAIKGYEKEKNATIADLKTLYAQRDDLQESLEQVKTEADEMLKDAQADAAKHIADLTMSYEDLEQVLEEKSHESEHLAIKIKRLENDLEDARQGEQESKKTLNELSSAEKKIVELDEKLNEMQRELNQKDMDQKQLFEQHSSERAVLCSQVEEKQSIIETMESAHEHLKHELNTANEKELEVDKRDRQIRSALSESDSLLAWAHEENKKVVNAFKAEKTRLESSLNSTLKALQGSEQAQISSKAGYKQLLQRLLKLAKDVGAKSLQNIEDVSGDSSEKEMHSTVNRVIVWLEEHLRGGQFLEVELSRLEKDNQDHENMNKELHNRNAELEQSCREADCRAQEMETKLNAATQNEETMAELVESSASKLDEQERAAELMLRSLHQVLEEKDSQIADVTEKYRYTEETLKTVSERLANTETTKEELETQLEDLSNTHRSVIENLAQERIISADAREKARIAEEALRRQEESSVTSMNDAEDRTREAEKRLRTAESQLVESQRNAEGLSENLSSIRAEASNCKRLRNDTEQALAEKCEAEAALLKRVVDLTASEKSNTEAIEKVKLELEKRQALVQALKEELTTQTATTEERLESLRSELQQSHDERLQQATEEHRLSMKKSADTEERVLRQLKSEMETLATENTTMHARVNALKRDFDNERSEKSSQQKDMKNKLEAVLTSKESFEKQFHATELLLETERANVACLSSSNESLQVELQAKTKEISRFQEKLSLAGTSISALEAKLESSLQNLSTASSEHSDVLDKLQSQIDVRQCELNDVRMALKNEKQVSEKCKVEIERLSIIASKSSDELASRGEEISKLEALLDDKIAEFARLSEVNDKDVATLKQKCADLERKNSSSAVALQAKEEAIRKEAEQHGIAKREFLSDSAAKKERIDELEANLGKTEAELAEMRGAMKSSAVNLESKAEKLATVESSMLEMTKMYEALRTEHANANIGEGYGSDNLKQQNEELSRKMGRWSLKMKKQTRKLRKLEKLLEAERRKNAVIEIANSKRLVSPSTKGMSPSLKRLRDLHENRTPLSPIPSNSRPPVAPRPSTRTELNF